MKNDKLFLIAVGTIVILYLLYKYNKLSDFDTEKLDNVKPLSETKSVPLAETKSVQLAETKTEIDNSTPIIGVYYTDWCGYSQQFLEKINNGVGEAIEKAGARVLLVDCDKAEETCAKYKIRGFPTILFHSPDGNTVPYNGARDGDSIAAFINKHK